MINIIVTVCTATGAIFMLVWMLRPAFRGWVEFPKYLMLDKERRFSGEGELDPIQRPHDIASLGEDRRIDQCQLVDDSDVR